MSDADDRAIARRWKQYLRLQARAREKLERARERLLADYLWSQEILHLAPSAEVDAATRTVAVFREQLELVEKHLGQGGE